VVERGGGACGACPEGGGVQAAQASSCAARCRTCSSAHVPRALPARAKRGGRSYSPCWHNSGVGQCPPLRGSSSVGKSEACSSQSPGHEPFSSQSLSKSTKCTSTVHALCFPPRAGPHRVRWPDRLVLHRRRRCRPHAIRLGGREWQRWPVTLCCGSVAGTRQASVVHQLWTPLHDHGGRH